MKTAEMLAKSKVAAKLKKVPLKKASIMKIVVSNNIEKPKPKSKLSKSKISGTTPKERRRKVIMPGTADAVKAMREKTSSKRQGSARANTLASKRNIPVVVTKSTGKNQTLNERFKSKTKKSTAKK